MFIWAKATLKMCFKMRFMRKIAQLTYVNVRNYVKNNIILLNFEQLDKVSGVLCR